MRTLKIITCTMVIAVTYRPNYIQLSDRFIQASIALLFKFTTVFIVPVVFMQLSVHRVTWGLHLGLFDVVFFLSRALRRHLGLYPCSV